MSSVSITRKSISCAAAMAAAQAAVRKAEELGIRINVSVCDSAGLEMAFLRMDRAFIHSMEIARDKAFTSAGFGMPSGHWKTIFEDNPGLEAGIVRREGVVTFGGGLPIMEQEDLIGGIGVSGGSEAEDTECAQAGLVELGLV